jgi:fructose-1-phosphate kinase PfkB-like protein
VRLRERLLASLPRARILVLAGSLPPGMTPGAAIDLLREARRVGVRSIVDAEGELLAAAIESGIDLVKPNLLEAGQVLGRELGGVEDAAAAAREIVSRGAGAAVITMRGDGAVAAGGCQAWQVRAPREDVVRAIGAGDSFAAGLAIGLTRGATLPEALRLAAAAGAATALHAGTGLGTPEEVERLLELTEVRGMPGPPR